MKKLIATTAAAALLAVPFAGKADAAEPVQVQTKVVYYQVHNGNYSNINDLYQQIFKKYNIKWDQKQYKAQPAVKETKKPVQVQQPKPTQQAPVQKKPAQPAPVQKQEKPAQQAPIQQKPAQQAPVQQQEKPATQSQLSAFEQQVFELTNQERAKNGLAPLKVDLELSKVAREKSRDMSANKYFSHNSPTYGSPFDMMKKFGITYRTAGENIAMGQRTPQEVVNAWMNSEGHRANILNKGYTHIGIGHDPNGNYWTQQFIGK